MKKLLPISFSLLILSFTFSNTVAQNLSSQTPNQEGIYVGASLLGASWNLQEYNFDDEGGIGLGLKLGYNFNKNVGVYASIDGTSINPDQGDNYGLGHFDLGAEGRIAQSNIQPFVRLSYLGMAVVSDNASGDIEITGTGIGLGPGVYYFPTNNLSLDLSYTYSWINISEIKVGSTTADVDEDAKTNRLSIGMSYYF